MKRLFILLLCMSLFVNAQEKLTLDAIQTSVLQQMALFPQEKIHVQTDRTMYIPGEKIWFKVYVVDAFLHLSPTYSQYVYIELINSSDSLIHRVMVTLDENKLFHGHIFLSEVIPEGDYTLRAYTRYMENLGDDYFFKKNIHIGNLRAPVSVAPANPTTGRTNTNLSREDYDVTFYPEGGNFPEGVHSRVAFKVLNQRGASESVTGMIVDREGQKIVEVETVFAGMGSFSFIPEPQQDYELVCKSSGGQEKRFRLPPAQKTITVSTNSRNNRHYIQVNKSPDIPEQPLYLLVHCKGEVLYFATWNEQNEFISLSDNQLPSGIIQVVLFDEQMNPVSERLLFNKNEEPVQFVFSTDKPYYQKREKVTSEIFLTDMNGITLAGNLSVAITDNNDIAIDSLNTITASLLLSSELRGYIESPGYYLQEDENAEYALDHLMLTHGWRRYEMAEVVKGNYRLPATEYELTKEITGKVQTPLLERPVANSEVMFVSNEEDFGETMTDVTGLFRLPVHHTDSTLFFVQAKNQRGGSGVEIVIYPEQFPKLSHAPVSQSLWPPESESEPEKEPLESIIDFLKKAEQRAQYDEDIRVISLEEVIVTARRIEKKDEVRLMNPINTMSSVTVYRDSNFNSKTASKVTDLLYGINGVDIRPDGSIYIHMPLLPLSGNTPKPIVLIDGMRIPWPEELSNIWDSPLERVSVYDVETIDVFIGGKASIFGAESAGGAISITTKISSRDNTVRTENTNTASIVPLGYQKPVEFYAPKYDTPELKNLSIPDYRTTIFWKPDLLVSDFGKASFEFYTSDFPTTYSVVIEGLSEEGNSIRHVETIEVR